MAFAVPSVFSSWHLSRSMALLAVIIAVVSLAPGEAFLSSTKPMIRGMIHPTSTCSHTPILRPQQYGSVPWTGRGKMWTLTSMCAESESEEAIFPTLKSKLQKTSLFFVGMDGCKKETIAKELAGKLGYKFMDTNSIIAELLEAPIEKAFSIINEDDFVKVERAVLDQVQAYYAAVVSTGSCTPLDAENWAKFRTGIVVYVRAEAKDLQEEGLQAPLPSEAAAMLNLDDAERRELLLAQRTSFYEQADVVFPLPVDAPAQDMAEAIAREVVRFIEENPAPKDARLSEAHAQALSRIMDLGEQDSDSGVETQPATSVPQDQIQALEKMLDTGADEDKSK
eukprot:CAMPEP_0196735070 /NCGR_PEP_ID=MMETSP1091-20130531/13630_1 /TAXON_ID=302021 /ORGANISM="Rhodomonas sp., Strain CCMP768" /LENGTH=337 /DNA_ID=CAMNT_0042078673 /DNA_START=18 /DNA_END=1031 /DNA_ORIENTATION=+